MALTSYITSTEANYFFPLDSNYTANQKSNALTASFGLVNSFVSSAVSVPVMSAWDGESTITAPQILKIAQSRFYRWLLESANVDHDDDLQALFDATKALLEGVTQDNLTVPGQVFAHQSGWHIVGQTIAGSAGFVQVRGYPPSYHCFYRLKVTTGGYPLTLQFETYRADASTVAVAATVGIYEWQAVNVSPDTFEVRWDGQWTANDEVRIVGVPAEEINKVTPANVTGIRQGTVAYSSGRVAHV